MTLSSCSVSELLQRTREAGGQSLDAIAKETCVSISYLRAIEEGNFDILPAEPFAAGFVKTYARALGLNQKEVLSLYKSERSPAEDASDEPSAVVMPVETIAVTVDSMPQRRMGWFAPVVAAFALAGGWTFFNANMSSPVLLAENNDASHRIDLARLEEVSSQLTNPKKIDIKSSTSLALVSTDSVPVIAEKSEPVKAEASDFAIDQAISKGLTEAQFEAAHSPTRAIFDTAAYADPVSELTPHANFRVDALEDTWIRFANEDGSEVWAGILTAGDSFNPQLNGKVLFSTSNAGGVKIYFDDQEIPSLGERGEIVKLAELSSEALTD